MAILTKADIINGKQNVQAIQFDTLGGELNLRPLTDGEINKIIARIKGGGLKNLKTKPVIIDGEVDKQATMDSIDINMDIEAMELVKAESDCMAVAFSLNNAENSDTYTTDDISQFPAGTVTEIALKVYEISGIDDPVKTRADVEDFRLDE